MKNRETLKFILSVDTEEEWDWSGPFPQDNCSVENASYLNQFQLFCDKLSIRPTYFVDYAVVSNNKSAQTLKQLLATKRCEIGAHLHPWCNPPYVNKTEEYQSHVINLPIDLVEAKLDVLTELIQRELNTTPKSFRTGRWGIDSSVLKLLTQKGYAIDSSVYPYYRNEVFSCDRASETPYWPDYNDPMIAGEQRDIYEVPITAGFNRSNFKHWNNIHRKLSSRPWSWLKLIGILWHSQLLRKIYLSPELYSAGDMINLIDKAIQSGHSQIHMYMHSSSLLPDASYTEAQTQGIDDICKNIAQVINHIEKKYKIEYYTISESAEENRLAISQ